MVDDNVSAALDYALSYAARGWAVVPLHDVADGRCSCGNPTNDPDHDRKQGGKHPRFAMWQANPLRDPTAIRGVWSTYPHANVGIATGAPSRFWVLDVDPDNGGIESLIELIGMHGGMGPFETYSVVTGSGGDHYYFAMPDDFEPTNRRGALPRGLDVRGTGGQVVAPPSRSGKGPYRVADASDIMPAPGWLLELIRPPVWDAPAGVQAAGLLPAGAVGQRGPAYAAAAARSLGAELHAAQEGTRNETAFRVACRLIELSNAPWADMSAGQAYMFYVAGAQGADGNGVHGFSQAEADAVWAHAARQVGDGAAVLPASELAGEALPFVGDSTVAPTSLRLAAGRAGADPFVDPGPAPLPVRSPGAIGASSVTSQVRGVTSGVTTSVTDPVMALLDQMMTAEQLRALPRPAPLVAGLLNTDSTAWLIGKSGSYKSFVALDLAARVGRGEPWQGRAVRQGLVVYLVAEGAAGMQLRTDAFERAYGPLKDVLFLPRPVQARGPEWTVLVEACRRLAPALIVLDTQARISLGLDENSNTDMGMYVEAIDMLRRATGACVLSVHHIGRSGSDARGASALDAAQDTELRCHRIARLAFELHVDKQKDQDQAGVMRLALRPVPGEVDPLTGADRSSLVLDVGTGLVPGELDGVSRREARARALYALMRDVFGVGDGGTRADIGTLFRSLPLLADLNPDAKRKAWSLAWGHLVNLGLVARMNSQERFKIIVVPDQSAAGALTPNCSIDPPDGWRLWRPDTEVQL